jgi:glycosyltransferase involved in cell wall biosynthesis
VRRLVVIPALNEERSLPALLAELRAEAPEWDVCVVDDGSSDLTASVARANGAVVLQLPFNLGIGGAVQTGYRWGSASGYEIVAQIDGDGQHAPASLRVVSEPVLDGRADMAIGSRFRGGGGYQSTWGRRIGIRYLSLLLRLRTGARVSDPTSGLRVVGPRALALFAARYPSDYPEPESIALAARSGLRIGEVAVTMRARRHGRSSIDALRALYYAVKVSLAVIFIPVDARRHARPSSE